MVQPRRCGRAERGCKSAAGSSREERKCAAKLAFVECGRAAAVASAAAPPCVVLAQMRVAVLSARRHSSVTLEDQICRIVCWIRYRRSGGAVVIRPPSRLRIRRLAATFLKHKLWRIRNTRLRRCDLALCLTSQVVDQTALCAPETKLARLLLVVEQKKRSRRIVRLKSFYRGVPINEDESGCCLGSR